MTGQANKMTDEQLSRRLGRYQTTETIGMLLGILLVIAGCISAFVRHDVILLSVLTFGGVALILLLALPAQKKKKALMQQQLGGWFSAELFRVFGDAPGTPELPINEAVLKKADLLALPWTECSVTDCYEGCHKGQRFSAANVELRRTVEERSGPDNNNWMTRSETLFRGIVLRCRGICAPALDLVLRDQFQERRNDNITDPDDFRKHFSAHTGAGRPADDMVTPQLRELVHMLETSAKNGKVAGLILQDGTMTLALNTGYVFAGVPESLDLRDIEGIRKCFTASLTGMERLLDMLMESPALSNRKE